MVQVRVTRKNLLLAVLVVFFVSIITSFFLLHNAGFKKLPQSIRENEDPFVPYSITVVVISNDRLKSLERLCKSLLAAEYYSSSINIRFSLEASSSPEVVDYVYNFSWPHGSKIVFRRMLQGGLIRAVAESWFPSSDREYGILLEDDIEVSPYYMRWVTAALDEYATGKKNADPRLVGFSLYTPRVTETTNPKRPFDSPFITKQLVGDEESPFLIQTPCSWGALFFPHKWKEFLRYMHHRLIIDPPNNPAVVIPGSRTNGWQGSWKKYFFELMWIKGYYMLYPNFPGQESFSTNHLEIGEHLKDMKDIEKRRKHFTVPLVASWNQTKDTQLRNRLKSTDKLPLLDLFGDPIDPVETLIYKLRQLATGIHLPKLKRPSDLLREGDVLLSYEEELMIARNNPVFFHGVVLPDCVFVLFMHQSEFDTAPKGIWATPTYNKNTTECQNVSLRVTDDGHLLLKSYIPSVFVGGTGEEKVLWTSRRKKRSFLSNIWSQDTEPTAEYDPSSNYELKIRNDGNLVVYDKDKGGPCDMDSIVWHSKSTQKQLIDSSECTVDRVKNRAKDICKSYSLATASQFRDRESMTLLVSFKDRFDQLEQLIQYYASSKYVSTILVVWHDVDLTPPPSARLGHVMVHFLEQSVDSLNNRFNPSLLIPTEAVLVIDDDIKVDLQDLHMLLEVWNKYPDHLVGFMPRWYDKAVNKESMSLKYLYSSEDPPSNRRERKPKEGYALMLTKIMLLHRNNLYKYTCGEEGVVWKIHEMVDRYMNCEDIGMNLIMALNYDNKDYAPPLFVKPMYKIGDFGKAKKSGLHLRNSHLEERTTCLNMFNDIYREKFNKDLPLQRKIIETEKVSDGEASAKVVKYKGLNKRVHIDCQTIEFNGTCSWALPPEKKKRDYKVRWV